MLPVSRAGAAPDSRPARLLMALLLLAVIAFVVSTIPGVRAATGFETVGFDPLVDGWLQGGGYVTAAALAASGPSLAGGPRDRAWLAAAVAARALGFVLFLASSAANNRRPSVGGRRGLAGDVRADAGRAGRAGPAPHPPAVAALVLDAAVGRSRPPRSPSRCSTRPCCRSPRRGPARRGRGQPRLSRAGPDAARGVIGMLLGYGWRPPPAAWALAAGVVGFAVIDGVFVYQSAGRDLPARDAALLRARWPSWRWSPSPAGSPASRAGAGSRCPTSCCRGSSPSSASGCWSSPRSAGSRRASSSPARGWRWPSRGPACLSGRCGRWPSTGARRVPTS